MRGKGEGAVYRQNDGLWAASIELPSHDGTRRRKVIRSKDKRKLMARLAELKRDLGQRGDIPTSTTTVEQWFTYWLEQIAQRRVRPKTYSGYESVTRRHIITALGPNTRLDKVTPQKIRGIETYFEAAGLSPTYALNAYLVAKSSLDDAVRENRIGRNPADLVDPPRKAVPEQEALTVEEAILVLEHIATDPLGPAWATALLTGARRGEVLGLEIDRVGDTLDLSWQLQRLKVNEHGIPYAPKDYQYRALEPDSRKDVRFFLTRPKSKAGWRVVPLVDPLRAILERHIATMEPNTYGLMFVKDGQPIEPTRYSRRWNDVLDAAGIDKHVVLHGLRHTAVDLLMLAGVPDDLIQEIVGHSSRSTTWAYKSRGNQTRLTEAMRRMSALLAPPADRTTL